MKRYSVIILAAVLSMLGIQTASAQQTQDALYIYRNDGGFNAFFFGDIHHIEYSKIDTLGVEQDDYVVQEVYALDTLYRIPLNAIDSVTFVTPETVYKKDVVHTTESDLWNYVIGSDSATVLILASNTPAAMIPKAGDKIVTTKSRNFLPGGFYGQVQSVNNDANGITVNCVVPALTELFDQFVCKAAAASVDPEAQARRRLFNNENSTEFTLPVYDKSLKIDLTNISYGINDNWSVAGSGVLDMGIKDVMKIRVFLAVRTILGINFDYVARMEKKSWFNLDLKGAVSGQFDVPLGKTYTWITDTPFAVETEAGVSVSGTGEMELKIKREHVTSDYAMVQYNDCFYDEKRESAIASTHLVRDIDETSLTGKFTVTAGPYFSSCLSLMKKEIGAVGTRYDAGLKAEVSAELKLTDYLMAAVPSVLPTYMIANPTALYDVLNRDGSVKAGPFCTGKIEATLGPWKKEFEMFDVNQMYGFEGGLVPKFSGTSLAYDKNTKSLKASANLTRKTLMGNKIGFAAYYTKSGKQAVRALYDKEYYYVKKEPNFKNWEQTFTGVGGGKEVRVYPITNIGRFNYEMLASPYVTYTIPAEMEVTPAALDFEAKGGTGKFTVKDNLDRKEDTYERKAEINFGGDDVKPWLKGSWSGDDYTVIVEKSDSNQARSATINFSISNADKSINLEKAVTVVQAPGEVIDYGVYADPTELTFTSAKSTQDVDIHCDWDNTPFTHYGARVREGSEWITVTAKSGQIHVTPEPNFEFKTREGYVDCYVRQKDRPESEWVFMPVKVTQGQPIKTDPSMKFLGKWTYENSNGDYYVEYTFKADGTYYSKWDTSSYKWEDKGTFVVNSYSEEENGDVVMVASINERYKRNGGDTEEKTTTELKLVKSGGYVNGVYTPDATRELQIGWNTYKKRN